MSGTATPIQATFLNRKGTSYSPYDKVPPPRVLNFNTDVRSFTDGFDLQSEFALNETFPVKSHDAVEFWFDLDGDKHQIGVGFLEKMLWNSDPNSSSLKANGRDLLGQLINIPFKKQYHYKGLSLLSFFHLALQNTYLKDYCAFRGLSDPIIDVGAYSDVLDFVTDRSRKRGGIIQEYSELALNLAYMNRLGQMAVYGRDTSPSGLPILDGAVGKFIKAPGKTNVKDMAVTSDLSKVFSECTVFYAAAEEQLDDDQVTSDIFKNSDPRVAHLYQPTELVFSATDLVALAGKKSPDSRMADIGRSLIRKSNQNIAPVVVTVEEPFFTDTLTKLKIPYETLQNWRVQYDEYGLDQVMTIAGLNYHSDEGRFELQISLVEPDTLV